MVNLATIYHKQENHEKAILILKNAETVLQQTDEPDRAFLLTSLYSTMGSIQQLGLSQLDSAAWYFEKALQLAKQSGDKPNEVTALHNVGEVYTHLGKLDDARFYLKQALNKSEDLGRPYLQLSVFRSLSHLHQQTGNFESALDFKNRQIELREALFEEETRDKVEQLETQYRTAIKDEEIQRQETQIAQQQLEAQKAHCRLIYTLLIALVLLLISGSVAVYYFQRKRSRERLEAEKSKIYQNIVHDIRTPLSLITGPLQKLRSSPGNEQFQQEFEWMERNARRLVHLVNELLEISRLDSGKYVPTHESGNPIEWLKNLTDTFLPQATEADIKLNFSGSIDHHSYQFAASALEHIAANLISNAIKFSPAGTRVDVRAEITHQNMLHLVVCDQGVGISERAQKHIFERFNRGDAPDGTPGTGVGLSIVHELCQLLGGDVVLWSKSGHGTEVIVSLPVYEAISTVEETPVKTDKPVVLLVEDDRDMATFTRSLLASKFEVLHAANGAEGSKMAEKHLPDLILTDVIMPVKDGATMLRELRDNPLTQHIPAIIFSAKSSIQSRLEGFEAGALLYLAKPFHPDELLMQCENLLNHLKRAQENYQSASKSGTNFRERICGQNHYLEKVVSVIEEYMDDMEFGVNELAEKMHLSRSQLHRKIKSITGFSAGQFLRTTRLEKAHDLIQSQTHNVTEAADAFGFSSQSSFTRAFSQHFHFPPSQLM